MSKLMIKWIGLVGGMLLLAMGAFYNGYPLLYTDSWIYLSLGFSGETVPDRSSLYSWFTRIGSLNGATLWTAILFQCLILSTVIAEFLKRVMQVHKPWQHLLIIASVVVASSLTFVVSQVMADAFTGIAILAAVTLLWPNDMSRATRILLSIIFVLSISFHFSHLLLMTGMVTILFVVTRLRRKSLPNLKRLAGLVISGWLLVMASNLVFSGSAKPIGSSQAFLLGRFYEDGILARHLREHCPDEQNIFCPFRDEMQTNRYIRFFLWSNSSPLRRWSNKPLERSEAIADRPEYRRLVIDIVRNYPFRVARAMLLQFAEQLVSFRSCLTCRPLKPGNVAEQALARWFPHELGRFQASRQQNSLLHFRWLEALQIAGMVGWVIVLFALRAAGWLRVQRTDWIATAMISLALALNALICGALSTALDRYQARVVWLLPLLAAAISARGVFSSKRVKA